MLQPAVNGQEHDGHGHNDEAKEQVNVNGDMPVADSAPGVWRGRSDRGSVHTHKDTTFSAYRSIGQRDEFITTFGPFITTLFRIRGIMCKFARVFGEASKVRPFL